MAKTFVNNIGTKIESFFDGGKSLPWVDSKTIARCKLEASGKKVVSSNNNNRIAQLAWALVHSYNAPDVQRGIVMLKVALVGVRVPPQKRAQFLYLLAVGQFRAGEFWRSWRDADQALKILPDFQEASKLKIMVMGKIVMDGSVRVGLVIDALEVVASGIATIVNTTASNNVATTIGGYMNEVAGL